MGGVLTDFVGRSVELSLLQRRLDRIAGSGTGLALSVRGRRQVGKSRLAQEFCDRAGLAYLFSAAVKGTPPTEGITRFLSQLKSSSVTVDPALVPEHVGSWGDALAILAGVLPDTPSIVVLDEVPWLSEQDPVFEGYLQNAWDRALSRKPVLLLLMGSDVHMMERMAGYDRPFYGRSDTMVLRPLGVQHTAEALGLAAADALDAQLLTGGLPGVLKAWPHGMPALEFVAQQAVDEGSPLFSVPELSLLAEFPASDHARRVLEAIGGGERTHANIAAVAGGRGGDLPSGVLSPQLRRLVQEKRVLAIDQPLSTVPGKPALYRVADSNLRFYLSIGREVQELAARGRSRQGIALAHKRWPTWRGRAIEPLVREALELAALAGDLRWPEAVTVGSWWNRRFDPEVDLVGADKGPVAGQVFYTGSTKWLNSPFDHHDLTALRRAAGQVPGSGAGTGLVVVSRGGVDPSLDRSEADLWWGPEDVLAAWQDGPAP